MAQRLAVEAAASRRAGSDRKKFAISRRIGLNGAAFFANVVARMRWLFGWAMAMVIAFGAAPANASRASLRSHATCTRTPDHGFGSYTHWKELPAGHMLLPRGTPPSDDGGYDVVIHFHRREAARRAFVEGAHGLVLVGIDVGPTARSYARVFHRPNAFPDLLANVTRALARYSGNPHAHIRHLALSSFSAGYGAVREILALYGGAIDAVVLLDSLHSDYLPHHSSDGAGRRVWGTPIASVIEYARRAARGEVTLFLSHSQVVPPTYASTSEVAEYLIDETGGTGDASIDISEGDQGLVSAFDRAGIHVRGYPGANGAAHCAQVGLLREALRDYLEPSWSGPTSDARASTIVMREVLIQ
jgi:hypothetical protein